MCSQSAAPPAIVGLAGSERDPEGPPTLRWRWHITAGDDDVATAVAALLGKRTRRREAPKSKGLDVATETTSLAVLLEGTDAIRTSVLLHDRREGPEGAGAEPRIEVYFRLADAPDLGIFKFQTGSWSLASDLAYYGTEDDLADLVADGHKVAATLTLEPVEFVAKSGPQAGKTVSYTKPVLRVGGE